MNTRTVSTLAALFACASAASADLVITEVMAQTTAGSPGSVNGDWWELTNTGPAAVNLQGYQWADTEDALPGTDSNFFGDVVINAGQSIIILEEGSGNIADWRTNWGLDSSVLVLSEDDMADDSTPDGDTFSGLSSGGDAVYFYNPVGVLLSSYTYSASTRGVSFEADRAGTDMSLSVIGENGAHLANNNDIGSPGYAVPAPGPAALFGLAAAGMGLRRRK